LSKSVIKTRTLQGNFGKPEAREDQAPGSPGDLNYYMAERKGSEIFARNILLRIVFFETL